MGFAELMTLIDLSAGVRLPHYEEEIFSDTELTEYYLRRLYTKYSYSVYGLAYYYAHDVMGGRWPEVEHIIAASPFYALYYARNVLFSRWQEAEATIASSKDTRGWYNTHFGTNI